MDEFTALDQGTVVQVANGQRWEKVDGGWRNGDGLTLGDRHFEYDLRNNRVTRTTPVRQGQVWQDGAYHYVVIQPDENRQGYWTCARLYSNRFHDLVSLETPAGRVVDRPDWYDAIWHSAIATARWQSAAVRNQNQMNQHATARDTAIREREALKSDVRTFLGGLVREGGVSRETCNEFLSAHGATPLNAEVPVTVTARVSQYVDNVEQKHLRKAVALEPEGDVTMSRATATYSFIFEKVVEAPEGTCACGSVTRRAVMEHLQEKGVPYIGYEVVDTTCPNH
jgi:hypothetical protein